MVDEASQEKLQHCKVQASNCIEAARESLSELSTAIWSCPELAFQETQAHDTLVRFFTVKQKGWVVQSHYKLETAFRATWGPVGGKENDRPINVGFLCEYDALPDIGHACGHNLIAEVGAAAALGLRGALESLETLPVRVMVTVLGTPAEEDGGGKIDLIEAGAFENMDVVFMAHPSQEDAAYLPDMAEHDVTVKYYGKASHAAAYPWEGINALDAAVLAYNNLSLLRQQLKPDWRLHGVIRHGGVKPNIVPSFSQLEFYLRTPMYKDLSVLREKAECCFKAAAIATGCRIELEYGRHEYQNVLPNKILEQLYEGNGKSLGVQFTTDETVLNTPSGSTDFGNVSYVVPGIHTYFYIGTEALNHTEEYTEATGSEKAQFYTLRTAKTLVMTALDVIFNPDIFQQVKENYEIARLKEENQMRGRISGNNSGPEHCSGAGSASR
ncbi:peptidase M20 domain-containing protein 2-like [Erpetoichthys calabaricus]|uniref:peptidase M20 domain-containing protein 2-like n=1 Tax=Erpetoichthys calabaricus TaxID=27687 RepID=UPI00223401AA|nr:peptidase M20 domain-containing protein 2-like [Erpetoichthys calabaricus]XP_051780768.1 peptidase M20 domain-containing protein 2-like [Erpetoichthys calabaricus]